MDVYKVNLFGSAAVKEHYQLQMCGTFWSSFTLFCLIYCDVGVFNIYQWSSMESVLYHDAFFKCFITVLFECI